MNVLIILQLSRSVRLNHKQFSGKTKSDILNFNIANIAEFWCEIGCFYGGSVIN